MICPHCKIGPMIHLGFGWYQCRLVDLKYINRPIDPSFFNPKCINTQKLG